MVFVLQRFVVEYLSLYGTAIRRLPLGGTIVSISTPSFKAYDILELLQQEDASAKPPTAYRALDFLLEHGFIHRIESLNAYIGCPNPEHIHDFQLLICNQCGQVDEITDPDLMIKLQAYAESSDFKLMSQVIELKGLCKKCVQIVE